MLLQKKIVHKKQKSKLPCHDEAISGAIIKYAFLSPNENGMVKTEMILMFWKQYIKVVCT